MEQDGEKEKSAESLFIRELRRRGIKNEKNSDATTPERTTSESSQQESEKTESRSKPPPRWAQSSAVGGGQLDKSRALSSEGIEGLIPRATSLIGFGATFWLAFWPFILAILGAFVAVYLYFGDGFIHYGKKYIPAGPPSYIDPYELLQKDDMYRFESPEPVPFGSFDDEDDDY